MLVGRLTELVADVAGVVEVLGGTAGMLSASAQEYREADYEAADAIVATWAEQPCP